MNGRARPLVSMRWIYRGLKQIKPLRATVLAVRDFYGAHRPHAWIVEGRERSTGEPLSLFFAGQLENKNFIAHLAFADDFRESDAGRVWLWSALSQARRRNKACGIALAQVPRRLWRRWNKTDRFFIPSWVSGQIDVPQDDSWFEKNSLLDSDLRRIRKGRFSYRVTRDDEAWDRFYWDMYVPYARKAFGSRACIDPHDVLKQIRGRGVLLQVMRGGDWLAGTTLHADEKGRVLAWFLGVKDGNRELVQQGVIGAIYYFALMHLKEKGHKELATGDSRPFLRDGVLRYKRKWGLRLIGSYRDESGFILSYDSADSGARAFLVNNPFIAEREGKLVGPVFLDRDTAVPDEDLQKLYADLWCPGLSELQVYSLTEGSLRVLSQQQMANTMPAGGAWP